MSAQRCVPSESSGCGVNAAVSWSGGKDSCLACFRAAGSGIRVGRLLNFVSRESGRVAFHGTPAWVIELQAEALGMPLAQYTATGMEEYENTFNKALAELKEQGVDTMVFGDIHIAEHRQWVELRCEQAALKVELPLWGIGSEGVVRALVAAGFRAIVVAARADLFDHTWIGRTIDHEFIRLVTELAAGSGLDVCGEQGEYHTLVVDGPLFGRKLEVTGAPVLRDGHWMLDLRDCRLGEK